METVAFARKQLEAQGRALPSLRRIGELQTVRRNEMGQN